MIKLVLVVVLIAAVLMAVRAHQQEEREARTLKSLPPSVGHVVAQLDPASQAAFFNEYESKKRRKSVGWIAWLLIGWHYLYARRVGLQFAFWLTLGGAGFWWFIDFFRMPSIIRSVNAHDGATHP